MGESFVPKLGNNELWTNESLMTMLCIHAYNQGPRLLDLILEARIERERSLLKNAMRVPPMCGRSLHILFSGQLHTYGP